MSKISVALAAYRGEKFIGRQVESLLRQTRIPDEIVITDDSPDELTREALTPFLSDPRIRYVRNPERLGVNANFENAIARCTGDIIFLCDQDDVWLPEKIRIMAAGLENDPAADGIFCDSEVVDETLSPLGYSLWQMREFSRGMRRRLAAGDALGVFFKRVTLSTHNIAIRSRVLPWIMPYPELDPFYSDTWIALRVASQGRWAMADEKLTLYRVHGDNLSAPKKAGLAEQARRSRSRTAKYSFRRTAELAEELIRRLPDSADPDVRAALEMFRRHYAVRLGYPDNMLLRSGCIMREILTGRYGRFSNGWKSAAADLLLFR